MRKLVVLQLTAFLLISGTLGGMFVFTPVYDEVHGRIVSVICLSCLKLQPKASLNFTFETANEQPHPDFLLQHLATGPLFLHYSADVCQACDVMLPFIQSYVNLSFNKTDFVTTTVTVHETNLTYIYINIDHVSQEMKDTIDLYDKEQISGLPMFTLLTLGYDAGFVKPAYASLYGEQPMEVISHLTIHGLELYHQNKAGYDQPHH